MKKIFSSKQKHLLPGFYLSLSFTWVYLGLIVLIPLSMLFIKSSSMEWGTFLKVISSPRALAAYRLTLGTSAIAALTNAVFGLLTAWVLVRYSFPGKKLINAIIDLPFALPTAVAGIALATIYAPNGWVGQFMGQFEIKTAFSPIGITIALIFISLPFVIRSVEPVLEDIDNEIEEAAYSLGANRWQVFYKVILPLLMPSLLAGTAMAFARAVGEYGSVVFISGNMPMKTEIVPLLIVTKLEQYDYQGATAIAIVMLFISFIILLNVNIIRNWSMKS